MTCGGVVNRDRCARCDYDFTGMDFSQVTQCPECGSPASVRVVCGVRWYEELATAVGIITGTIWLGFFVLLVPEGIYDAAWWLVVLPLTAGVLGAVGWGVHVLSTRRSRGRRLALVMALSPMLVPIVLIAGAVVYAML